MTMPLPMQFPIVIDTSHSIVEHSVPEDQSNSGLAIVPYQPTLHVVLITLWATALDNSA